MCSFHARSVFANRSRVGRGSRASFRSSRFAPEDLERRLSQSGIDAGLVGSAVVAVEVDRFDVPPPPPTEPPPGYPFPLPPLPPPGPVEPD